MCIYVIFSFAFQSIGFGRFLDLEIISYISVEVPIVVLTYKYATNGSTHFLMRTPSLYSLKYNFQRYKNTGQLNEGGYI